MKYFLRTLQLSEIIIDGIEDDKTLICHDYEGLDNTMAIYMLDMDAEEYKMIVKDLFNLSCTTSFFPYNKSRIRYLYTESKEDAIRWKEWVESRIIFNKMCK